MPYTHSHWLPDTSAPVHESTIGSVLAAAAADVPDATALVSWLPQHDQRRAWTYAQLQRDAQRTARALLTRFAPGERIAVWAHNIPEWLLLEFGAALAGLVLVTVNPGYRPRELAYVLQQSRAAGLFHVREVRGNPMTQAVAQVRSQLPGLREVIAIEQFEEFLARAPAAGALPEVKPGDAAQIQYTSGTTGFPKGALLHHRGITNNARLVMQRFQCRPGDVFAHAMPFFHTGGCVCAALGSIQARATHGFLPGFDAGHLLELVERERATHVFGVPTMLLAMMAHPGLATRNLSSLRASISGGASVPAELVREIEAKLGLKFSIIFGQTESSPVVTMTRLDDTPEDKAATIGQPLPQTEVKIVDPASGEILPVGQTGELCTRGYLVMHGYNDNPQATAAAIDADGWLHTGDLASMDARGYFRIRGRLKEMVIRGGENLFPVEIENVLHEHAEVGDVAVVGVPDERMGEELAAFVRRAAGSAVTEETLRTHVRTQLAAQKTPRYWIFVDEFPLTGSGKVQKFVLRERWERGEFAPGRNP
ncbi:MAG TPA: AMP-binding protein [Nevskiaceae bacterium]|nr:AMP-binding protein [Nevskiaceae bacterium]